MFKRKIFLCGQPLKTIGSASLEAKQHKKMIAPQDIKNKAHQDHDKLHLFKNYQPLFTEQHTHLNKQKTPIAGDKQRLGEVREHIFPSFVLVKCFVPLTTIQLSILLPSNII